MAFLSDLFSFIWAVINSWAGYATGGVIVALVALWATLRQKQVPRSVGVGLAVLFLLFAFFHAWRDERRAAIEARSDQQRAQDELRATKNRTNPKIKGEILFSSLGIKKNDPDVTSVVFIVSLSNTGAPSITKDWSVTIDIPGRGSISSTPAHYPRGVNLGDEQQDRILENADAIYEKTAEHPVIAGAEVHGFLVFEFKGVRPDEIDREGTRVRLTFLDVSDRENAINGSWPVGQNLNALPHVPGIRNQRSLGE